MDLSDERDLANYVSSTYDAAAIDDSTYPLRQAKRNAWLGAIDANDRFFNLSLHDRRLR